MTDIQEPETRHAMAGIAGVSVLRVAADVADTETVTIGQNVYEFDRAANGVTAGRIAVTGHADDTPGAATDALILAINSATNGSSTMPAKEPVLAVDISANEIAVFTADAPGGSIVGRTATIAVSETLAGVNNAWSAATIGGGDLYGAVGAMTSRVPNATEVALGNMHFGFPFAVGHVMIDVRVTATGVRVAWAGGFTISGRRVTLDNSGATDWAATDTVTVIATE